MTLRILASIAFCVLIEGCATVPVGQHQPPAESVVTLRDSGIAAVNVGEFKLAAGLNLALDKSVSVRGNQVDSPNGNSFSLYLKESLIADLKAAGKYDATAPLSIQGELTENELNAAGFSEANAVLAAHFTVKNGNQLIYDRVLRQQSTWKSSFVGAIAIPEARNQYANGYTKLLAQLYADQNFRTACGAGL
jgi:hypothetical protein